MQSSGCDRKNLKYLPGTHRRRIRKLNTFFISTHLPGQFKTEEILNVVSFQCKLGSETASMQSISSTDNSFKWKPPAADGNIDEESDTESKVSGSQLVDSCL